MPGELELPPHLVAEVEHGNVVLLLGAGASLGSTNKDGKRPPLAGELAELLATKFLTPAYAKKPLNQVAEYAISESDLFTVQDYIADYLRTFPITATHKLMTTFRWRAIATTNYDNLIELAYEQCKENAIQSVVPVIDNNDRYDGKIKDRNDLLLLKLHGCVTRTHNKDCPLILTTDQYINYNKGRGRLFDKFRELGAERSIVFVGYGLQDPNLRQIIDEIGGEVGSRPRYYLVSPGVNEFDKRVWETKKIAAIPATFDEFFEALNSKVGPHFRGLMPPADPGSAGIRERFLKRDSAMSANAVRFVENHVDYVNNMNVADHVKPQLFYRGSAEGWGAIEQELDVRRHLTDNILSDYFLNDAADLPNIGMILIKGYAGAGKSILLRRLAWSAAKEFSKLCLYLREEGTIDPLALAEVAELTKEPVYLFVDNLLTRPREIERLFQQASTVKGKIIVVATSRTNEWNVASDSLKALVSDEYDTTYLSNTEIERLLKLLEKHKALGRLEPLNDDQRREDLSERAGRQLLVALHEATLGKSFETIIRDEYDHVTPDEAKQIYLTVCLLNQFNAPVRAGVVSRMYDVPFETFQQRFFKPLEGLVIVRKDKITGDYCYTARHPHIAEIVVHSVLNDPDKLFGEIVATIQYLNMNYRSDLVPFRRLVSARLLTDNLRDPDLIEQVYEAALKVSGKDPITYQQMGIHEMNRPGGDLEQAEKYINQAVEQSPNNPTFRHSLAELHVRRAERATAELVKNRHLAEAEKICGELKRQMSEPYPYYTLVKIFIARLQHAIDNDATDQTIETLTREAEEHLFEGKERFPDNAELQQAEANLHQALSRSEKAFAALRKSFELNPRKPYIAIRLAQYHRKRNEIDAAVEVIKKALDAKQHDPKLNFVYADLMRESGKGTDEDILYHLSKSYSAKEQNLDAQLLHARQAFIMGDLKESDKLFSSTVSLDS